MVIDLPKNPEEKHAMVKAMFFAQEYEGMNVTDRISQLSKKIGMSTTNLYVTYYPKFKTDYELSMRAYAQKKQDEATQKDAIRVLGATKPGDIEDANINSAALASNMVHNILVYKSYLLQQVLEKVQRIIAQCGGSLNNATPSMLLQLKSLDREINEIKDSVSSYVNPDKIYHYMSNITNLKALGAGGKKVFSFSDILKTLAETDSGSVKEILMVLFPEFTQFANVVDEVQPKGLDAVSALIEKKYPNLPDISGDIVEQKHIKEKEE
jgi:hypothetical protein